MAGQGDAGHGKAWHGKAWRCNTRAWRGIQAQFSKASPGWARLGVAERGAARPGSNATGGGNPGHFPKHQEAPAQRGATVEGMTEET